MSPGVADYLNALPVTEVRAQLTKCCAATRWVSRMVAERPFGSDAAVFASAQDIWKGLTKDDWLEAFAAHPRIGEQARDRWAAAEQSGAAGAPDATRQSLAEGNREYEKRFGHVFLICATGLSADAMLAELERRLGNDPAKELEIAAAEQAKITRLRLEKLVTP